ncbi:unnamed protein product [Penicillium pancosmium]
MDDLCPKKNKIKAVFFDFMGTCLDWHSSVVQALPTGLSEEDKSNLALEWRQAFFDAIRARPPGELPENIDTTHRRVLLQVLARPANVSIAHHFNTGDGDPNMAVELAVQSWHKMNAWPDVGPGLQRIKSECKGCELFVLANGTTRLQLDLVRSSGLDFDMLFSTKPTPAIYRKAMELVQIETPSEAVMVAAHAYDLRAAKEVGMKTIYIKRWTDDRDELDPERIDKENEKNVLGDFEGLSRIIAKF